MSIIEFPTPESLAPFTGVVINTVARGKDNEKHNTWLKPVYDAKGRKTNRTEDAPIPLAPEYGNVLRSVIHAYDQVYRQTKRQLDAIGQGKDRQAQALARQDAEIAASVQAGDSLENVWKRAGHLGDYIPESFAKRVGSAAVRRLELAWRDVAKALLAQSDGLVAYFEDGPNGEQARKVLETI